MESTLQKPALSPTDLSMPRSKGIVIGFWIVTALFCMQIGFTAYAQLRLPQVAEACPAAEMNAPGAPHPGKA